MEWPALLETVADEPAFTSSLLKAGETGDAVLHLQLSRWARAGRLLQLRRGVYVLAPPYRKVSPHPFYLAGLLRRSSYVSLQAALAHHGLIPESVPAVTSVTTARPERIETALGQFSFTHLQPSRFFGYLRMEVADRQHAFVARPEKALLDLAYVTPGGDDIDWLRELRLQNLEAIDQTLLAELAKRMAKPKLTRTVRSMQRIIEEEAYETL